LTFGIQKYAKKIRLARDLCVGVHWAVVTRGGVATDVQGGRESYVAITNELYKFVFVAFSVLLLFYTSSSGGNM